MQDVRVEPTPKNPHPRLRRLQAVEAEALRGLIDKHWAWNGNDFFWKVPTSGRVKAGDFVGTVRPDGYVQVYLAGVQYRLHNLVWLWHKGYWPKGEIDHKDNNPLNNRIDNLRETSSTGQKLNARGHTKSGLPKGIAYDVKCVSRPYRVQISRHYKIYHRSYHATLDEAIVQADKVYAELAEIEFG